MPNYNKDNVLYAGFFVRLSAYLIDCILVGTVLLAIKIPKFVLALVKPDAFVFKPILFRFSAIDILLYLLSLTYFVLMTYYFGATLGKKALNIKVRKAGEEKLSLIDVVYRESIGRYLSALILCIGYIMILADSKKRALHDILCETIVVYSFNENGNMNRMSDENKSKEVVVDNTIKNIANSTDNEEFKEKSEDNNEITCDKKDDSSENIAVNIEANQTDEKTEVMDNTNDNISSESVKNNEDNNESNNVDINIKDSKDSSNDGLNENNKDQEI